VSGTAVGQVSVVLLDRARRGDGAAFESLLRTEELRLYAHVARILGPGADAEDVVQEACVSAWRSIRSFEGTSFRAWLFRIATNRAIDVIRLRRRRGELPLEPAEDDEPSWPEPAAPGADLADLAGDREALGVVEEALGTLAPEQRAALLLRDVEGFPYDEIARITASEIGTVKSRIHRGRLAVRNALLARGWKGSAG
jgi:RNA polymerase sigma-70 factor (ECF subfamily)